MKRILWFFLCAAVFLGGPAASPLAAAEPWEPLGPSDTRVLHLVVHPGDPRILWAGTLTGLFKSVDGGASWTPSSGLIGVPISTLAVAPSDPDTLYATVPSLLGGIVAVIRSSDGGEIWSATIACPSGGTACRRLAQTHELDVDPRNPLIVYASTDRGLLKSVDGGQQWRATGRLDFTYTLAIDPSNPRVLWAGGEGGVFKSEDRGITWVSRLETAGINEIVIDSRDPRRIWASALGLRGVYRTTDGGARWRLGRAGLHVRGVRSLALSAAPGRDFPIVWAGTDQGAFRSLDGGILWTPVPGLLGLQVSVLVPHPSRPGTLWAASSLSFQAEARSGVYKSVNGGAAWRFSSRGLFGPSALALTFDPVVPGVLWVAAGLSGVFRSTDGGGTWTPRNTGLVGFESGLVYDVALDPRDPETVWIGTATGIYRSGDGGATWEAHSLTAAIRDVRLTSDPAILYASSGNQLLRSVDGGEHWADVFGGSPTSPYITDVLVDPRDPDVVFLATGDVQGSRDGGVTWETVPVRTEPASILVLALDPRNPDVLYAGGGSGLFRSADNGRTWQQVAAADVPGAVGKIAVGPTGEVWVTTAHGMHVSPDGVSDWAAVPDLTGPVILEIAVDPHDSGRVFLGTTAGIFRFLEGD